MTAKPTEPDLKLTEADLSALREVPAKGWFDWYDVILIRCTRFRLERLDARGVLESKVVGEWPDLRRLYRMTKKGRAINGY